MIAVNQKEDTPSIETNVKDAPADNLQTSNTSTGTRVDENKENSVALNFQEVSFFKQGKITLAESAVGPLVIINPLLG